MIDVSDKAKAVESKLTAKQQAEIKSEAAAWFHSGGTDYIDACDFAGWQPQKLRKFVERLEAGDDESIATLLRLRSHLLHRGNLSEKNLEIEP